MHVTLCGGYVEVNTHFDVNSSKSIWSSMLKPLLQQAIHLCAFYKITGIGGDRDSLLFKILRDASLNFKDSGGTDLPGGDHAQLIKSIKDNLLTLPDDTKVYGRHGPVTAIGEERNSNPFFVK